MLQIIPLPYAAVERYNSLHLAHDAPGKRGYAYSKHRTEYLCELIDVRFVKSYLGVVGPLNVHQNHIVHGLVANDNDEGIEHTQVITIAVFDTPYLLVSAHSSVYSESSIPGMSARNPAFTFLYMSCLDRGL